MIQLLGYAASILIATSLLMRSIVRLRVINFAGAALFSTYGFLIGAYPVGILNLMTAGINVVQLVRLRRSREIFRVIEIKPDSTYLEYFFQFLADDIRKFFPRFRHDPSQYDLVLLVLRDLVPAGVFIARVEGERAIVLLDYVVPQYRDLKVGRYLFLDQTEEFRRRGIHEITTDADTEAHADYLRRIGFEGSGLHFSLSLRNL
jgi:GNAT superfamily N-acetyltransferase